jgi:hypothetical protein
MIRKVLFNNPENRRRYGLRRPGQTARFVGRILSSDISFD